MKNISTQSKAVFFSFAFILLVSTFYWIIINFSMKRDGLEHLIITHTEEAYSLIRENRDNPEFRILDTRTHLEYFDDHLEDAKLVSYTVDDFQEQLMSLDMSNIYPVYCWRGSKNKHIRVMMEKAGFL